MPDTSSLARLLAEIAAASADPLVEVRNAVHAARSSLDDADVRLLADAVRVEGVHPQLLHYTLRAACGYEPVPGSAALAAWLIDHAADIAGIVEPDLRTCSKYYSDWSADAADPIPASQYDDAAGFTRRIWAGMAEVGASVAIGGYGHVRPVYGGALFQAQSAEPRTLHIGLDVFMDAGAPIFAPMDGEVHSLAFNDAKFDYGPTIVLTHHPDPAVVPFHTLYGHLSLDSLDGLDPGMPIRRGQRIGCMGNYPVNGDWPPHVHVQIILDMLDRRGDFNGSCRPSQWDVWRSLCPDANLITQIPADFFSATTSARRP